MVQHADIDHTGLTGVGGIGAGTSFPGSPANNDLFFRTDRDLLYFYDGTRWLTVQLYEVPMGVGGSLSSGISATATVGRLSPDPDYSWWLEDVVFGTHVATTNNGTDFWTMTLRTVIADNTPTTVATRSTGTGPDAASTWVNAAVAIDAVVAPATVKHLTALATKSASAGLLTFAVSIKYRLVG